MPAFAGSVFGASRYSHRDYSTVHDDVVIQGGRVRRLALVLHLSEGSWREECGGALLWCDPRLTLTLIRLILPDIKSTM